MSTSTKSHLPPEILSSIFEFASVPSKSALCNVALCSSFFYSLAVPILYAELEFYSRSHSLEELRALTILFLSQPRLAQSVRRFTLRDPHKIADLKTRSKENLAWDVSDSGGVVKDAISANSYSVEEFDEWMIRVSEGYPDALLTILLPTMVRLKKLDLVLRPEYLYFERMLTRAIGRKKPFDRQPLFPELTEFMHAASWEVDDSSPVDYSSPQPMSLKYSTLIQAFPCIRSIFGHRVVESYDEPNIHANNEYPIYPVLRGLCSSLTHFELKSSFVDQPSLCAMLEIPHALSTFIYEISQAFQPARRADESLITRSPLDVLIALLPQYNSLENLWLDCENPWVITSESDYQHNKVPLLPMFSRLKNLRVVADILLQFLYPDHNGIPFRSSFSGLFPATLETLHIRYMESLILWEELREFVQAEASQVPRLKTIVIEFDSSVKPPLDWKEFREDVKSQGVELISVYSYSWQCNGFWCERGWGMEGSIKWARCVDESNSNRIPVIKDWKDDWKTIYNPCRRKDSGAFFYKWHLCHEGEFDPRTND
jgi:hypothetical protein